MNTLVMAGLALMLLAGASPAGAQNVSDLNNNPFPTLPWASPWSWQLLRPYGTPLRTFDVPPRAAVLTVDVPRPGLPAPRSVIVPGYRVVETTLGFLVHEHWGWQTTVEGVYHWTWFPTAFWPR